MTVSLHTIQKDKRYT